jgi:hypothetical protein
MREVIFAVVVEVLLAAPGPAQGQVEGLLGARAVGRVLGAFVKSRLLR